MARRDESILELFILLPWWVGVAAAFAFFIALRFVVPAMAENHAMWKAAAPVMRSFSWLSFAFLVLAGLSALRAYQKRERLDRQSGIESIRALPWNEFEELLAEAYRRMGYTVHENMTRGPDGGYDILLEKGNGLTLVQCKQWLTWKVGVNVVREMFGIMHDHEAAGVIIVTSGMFTQEAKNFAAGKPIDLIEGDALAEMIQSVQRNRYHAA